MINFDEHNQMSSKKKRKLARKILKKKVKFGPFFANRIGDERELEFLRRHEAMHALIKAHAELNMAVDEVLRVCDPRTPVAEPSKTLAEIIADDPFRQVPMPDEFHHGRHEDGCPPDLDTGEAVVAAARAVVALTGVDENCPSEMNPELWKAILKLETAIADYDDTNAGA